MKTIPSYEPFEFQKNSINLLLEIIKHNHGACIFDETGLGKTITASTAAINLTDGRINIISPKSNQRNWKNVLKNTTNSFDIYTFVKPPTEPSEVLIIDEGHNLRNLKSKSFIKVFEYVKKYNPIVIILTATPFQNNIREFRDVLSLINFKTDTPAFISLGIMLDKAIETEKKLNYIDRYSEDVPDFGTISKKNETTSIKESLITNISKVVSTFSIRNTRESIVKDHPSDVELMGHFPKIEKINLQNFFSSEEISKISNIIKILHSTNFAIQNKLYYSNHPKYKTQQSFKGLIKTFLLKRLDSSVHAFKKSIEKMILNVNQELNKSTHSVFIDNIELPLSNAYRKDLEFDKDAFLSISDILKELNDDGKLNLMLKTISDEKTVIFTEYKDTLEIISEFLDKNYSKEYLCYTSDSNENLLESIQASFDANYDSSELFDINVLAATDVLSEGVSLHNANILIHFDQKWNPSKITQRNGRIDRILKSGISKNIKIYYFQIESVIENIIELDKKITTKQNVGEKIIQRNTLNLQWLKDYKPGTTLMYLTNDNKGRNFYCYETYMGHLLIEEIGFLGQHGEPVLEPLEIPDIPSEEEKYYPTYFYKKSLYHRFHPEFNLLYRDIWGELAKVYSKNKTVDPFNIEFLKNIDRAEPKNCALWLYKRKYLK